MIQYYHCPTWPAVVIHTAHIFPALRSQKKLGKNVENELKVGYRSTILQYTLPILLGKEIAGWDRRRGGNLWSEICECGPNRLCFVCLLLSNLQIIAADICNARTRASYLRCKNLSVLVSNPRHQFKAIFHFQLNTNANLNFWHNSSDHRLVRQLFNFRSLHHHFKTLGMFPDAQMWFSMIREFCAWGPHDFAIYLQL